MWMQLHVEAEPHLRCISLAPSMLLIETGFSLAQLLLNRLGWLAVSRRDSIHPSPSPQGWDYEHISSHLAF